MSSAALTPRVRAMLVCQGIRGRRDVAGVFDLRGVHYAVSAARFPFVASRLWLFLVLTSPRKGRFPAVVRVVHDQTDRAAFMTHVDPSPEFRQGEEFRFFKIRLRCRFREPGRYTVQVGFFQSGSGDVIKAEAPFYVVAEGV